ncbi:MAG: hypothetical protein CMO80_16805 [Verrucomicrobiales bacterium]|nr:hypothetical protein [Verrucomicrobiales bacterium]|tara:strand:+ start:49 stop:783 length:735 start_codon:yes stop_codon:yes gene_type:complete
MKLFSTTQNSQRPQLAFTLLELLVASGMFAIMMASISTAFFGAYKLRETNEADIEGQHQIRRALAIIKRDLRSATLPSTNDTTAINVGSEDETNATVLAGAMMTDVGTAPGSQFFSFYTTSGIIRTNLPWNEIQYVAYELRPSMNRETNGLDVVRTALQNLLTDTEDSRQEQVLLSGVETMLFEFFDGQTWLDYWDSTTQEPQVPQAVRATIMMVPEAGQQLGDLISVVAPISVQITTNQASLN